MQAESDEDGDACGAGEDPLSIGGTQDALGNGGRPAREDLTTSHGLTREPFEEGLGLGKDARFGGVTSKRSLLTDGATRMRATEREEAADNRAE